MKWLVLMLFYTGFASAAILREDIGVLKIQDLLLRPNFLMSESHETGFSLGESSVALRWELGESFGGVIRIGPRTLLNPLIHYIKKVPDDVTLVEAYGEYNHPYGRFRMGRLPVEFGYEGREWERELVFPRSLLFQNRAMMLRDVGFSYEITHNDIYTGFVIHNGESDTDADRRIWYTARFGYKVEKWEIGLAGQTGSTTPLSSLNTSDTLAGVDPTKEARWRTGGLFWALRPRHWEWVTEVYAGEREQETQIGKFFTGHSDLSYEVSRRFSAHLRYDHFDPNTKMDADLQRQVSLGLMFSNMTHSSNIILVGTKVIEEGHEVGNDQLMVIWSLSPSGVVRF